MNDRYPYEIIKSPHYDNPWATAFARGINNPLWETVSWAIANGDGSGGTVSAYYVFD